MGQVSSDYFGLPCHSFIPQSSPSIIQSWYNMPINDLSNSDLGSTPAPQLNIKIDVISLRFPEMSATW
jgi:hypothetical protein